MKRILFYLSILCCTAGTMAQTASNVRANFTDCHVEVQYDLETPRPVDLVLEYSGDGGKTWIPCGTVSGDLSKQEGGNNKLIIWDNQADNIRWGKITFRVVAPIFTGCTVKSTLPAGELTFLCYNLGANENMTIEEQMKYVPTGNTDATVYGDLYQWGRFEDGHEKRTSGTRNVLSGTDNPPHSDFIYVRSGNLDWRSPQKSTLWGATKTLNDPCPEGWRVPTQAEWESIYLGASGNTWVWNSTGTPGWKISPDGGKTFTLFLPAAGRRFYWDGTFENVGLYGYYWSSNVTTTGSNSLFFNSTNSSISIGVYRANGYSCRCVEE